MKRIKQSTLDEIRQIPILDVARDLGLTLTRHGSYYFTNCFLHEDSTPSLWIKPSYNFWKCEGCGAKGDQIALVRNYLNIGFMDAVEWLAGQYAIEIRYEQ